MNNLSSIGQTIINISDSITSKIYYVFDFVSESNTFIKILGFIVILVLIYITYVFIKKYRKYLGANPVFFRNGIDGKIEQIIKDKDIIRSSDKNEFTYNFNLYISDWNYNIYWHKPILVKSLNFVDVCPMISLNPIKNDLSATINTESGNQFTLTFSDFPIKKWTSVTIILNEKIFELYINGLLADTVILDSAVKYNNGDLHVFPWGGMGGFLSKLTYSNKALSSKQIYSLSRMPIMNLNIVEYILNPKLSIKNVQICDNKYDKPNESHLDDIPKESLKTFGSSSSNKSTKNIQLSNTNLYNRVNRMSENAQSEVSTNDNLCPIMIDAPLCPVGTLACDSNQKYCYYPDRDIMVSTYYDDNVDFCTSTNKGKQHGNIPFQINGKNVWEKKRGKDTTQCKNIK
jgi:hypothetical protein